MKQENHDKIIQALSFQRLERYIRPNDSKNLELAIKRYQLNIQLSQSFYPALHIIEVTLRNQVYEALKNQLGRDWLLKDKQFNNLFRKSELDKTEECIKKLRKNRKPIETPNLIAELNFGYWTSLFTSYYESLWRKSKSLKTAFPNLPKHDLKRKSISVELNAIRRLRNRIFHYEPIWHWSDLPEHHKRIIKVIQWMNNEASKLLNKVDLCPTVFRSARKEIFD